MSRSRAWTFTINNDTVDDLVTLLDTTFRYCIFGFEQGKEGTHHMQGYIYFYNQKRLNEVKNHLPRAHLEVARGTPDQNYNYCSKEGDFYEFGDKPCQGTASWERIEDVMEDPASNFHLYTQYRRAHKEYSLKLREKADFYPTLMLMEEGERYKYANICKEEGMAISMYPSDYDGEAVRIQPMYACTDDKIMNWLNGYPVKEYVGYELHTWNPKLLIITYSDKKERMELQRQYDEYVHMDVTGEPGFYINW